MPQLEKSINCFLDDLSSRAATPGGGSASALVGAIAGALCGMVGRLNDKKDGSPGPLHDTIACSDILTKLLLDLVERDIDAFNALAASWKLPDDPANAAAKQAAVIKATQTPLDIMSAAVEIMTLAEKGLAKSKKNCLSDAGVAGLVAHAALEGARLNVMINLAGITDSMVRQELTERARNLREQAKSLREKIDRGIAANYPD